MRRVLVFGLGLSLAAGTLRAEPTVPEEFLRNLQQLPFEFGPDWRPFPPGPWPPQRKPSLRERREDSGKAKDSLEAQKRAAEESRAEALRKALAPQPAFAERRKKRLDDLFERLRTAPDPGKAKTIAASIEQVWLETPSDTAKLLLDRAFLLVSQKRAPVALTILDKLVVLEPDWAEAWNRRATTRYMTGDVDGAMADIDIVLKLEPRHFGALSGMGVILRGVGRDVQALRVFTEALAIHPMQPELRALVDDLTHEIEGRHI
jgi:Flp pilus assembly protein TadD